MFFNLGYIFFALTMAESILQMISSNISVIMDSTSKFMCLHPQQRGVAEQKKQHLLEVMSCSQMLSGVNWLARHPISSTMSLLRPFNFALPRGYSLTPSLMFVFLILSNLKFLVARCLCTIIVQKEVNLTLIP